MGMTEAGIDNSILDGSSEKHRKQTIACGVFLGLS